MVELGWAGMVLPEALGGSGSSFVELGVLYEAMGEYIAPSPQLTVALSSLVLLAAGDASWHPLLRRVAEEGTIVACCLTEPQYGWDAGHVKLRARRADGGYVLDGSKMFIPYADLAE